MRLRLKDNQNGGGYFCDGYIFPNEECARVQLISYHSIDSEENLEEFSFEGMLEYGQWEVEEIKW